MARAIGNEGNPVALDSGKRIHQLDEARLELEDANQQMKQGLEAAAKTQQSLLPKSPPDDQSIRCSWSYEPSDHLGGDSINIFRLTENKVGFFIADVCGHGLPSALLAVSLHRVLTPTVPNIICKTASQFALVDNAGYRQFGKVINELFRREHTIRGLYINQDQIFFSSGSCCPAKERSPKNSVNTM